LVRIGCGLPDLFRKESKTVNTIMLLAYNNNNTDPVSRAADFDIRAQCTSVGTRSAIDNG